MHALAPPNLSVLRDHTLLLEAWRHLGQRDDLVARAEAACTQSTQLQLHFHVTQARTEHLLAELRALHVQVTRQRLHAQALRRYLATPPTA